MSGISLNSKGHPVQQFNPMQQALAGRISGGQFSNNSGGIFRPQILTEDQRRNRELNRNSVELVQ